MMCLFDRQVRQAVPPCEFHMPFLRWSHQFLPRPHYRRQLHSFRLLSKGRYFRVPRRLCCFAGGVKSPPRLSLYERLLKSTAPPAAEPIIRNAKRQYKNFLIFPPTLRIFPPKNRLVRTKEQRFLHLPLLTVFPNLTHFLPKPRD